jgi:hypothetical protein
MTPVRDAGCEVAPQPVGMGVAAAIDSAGLATPRGRKPE